MYVYILRCSDDTYYTGVTNDVKRRLKEHQAAIDPNSYTARRLPVELMVILHFTSPTEAILAEKQIKDWNRKKKEALIRGEWHLLSGLAKKN